ncbi:MAG: HD domain-containing protein [Actinomycetota bacterium]|nr:HD domain-containing protein [Actinomycetota bacterium]
MKFDREKALRWLSSILCLLVLAACIPFIKWGDLDPGRTLGLVAILAFFETWRIQYRWGRPLRLGMAVTLCVMAIRPLPEAVWIFFLGSMLGRGVSMAIHKEEESDFFHIVQRTYIVALTALVYQVIINLGWNFTWNPYPPNFFGPGPASATEFFTYYNPAVLQRALVFPIAFIVMAVIFYLGEVFTSSVETGMTLSGSWRVILPQHMRQTFPAYLAISGAGALMALYFPRIAWFNFLIFFIPLLLVRLESNRDKELDERYFQTMRIIGDAFDLARGLPGHSGRVSNLSAEVAREMGVARDLTRNIRYAAALHDIGRVEFEGDEEAKGHAERGAEVLEQVPRLQPIADIVRYHHPGPGDEAGTQRLEMGSKIIGVVSDYDLLTNRASNKLSSEEALKEMSVERGKLYDSKVLRTLAQVVETQAMARRRPEREIQQRAKVLEKEELGESLEEIFRDKE